MDRFHLGAQVQVVRVGLAEWIATRCIGRGNDDKTLNVIHSHAEGEGTADHGVDGGVGADTEPERNHRDDREAGTIEQRAGGVANILPKGFDPSEGPHIAAGFFQRGWIAEVETRRGGVDPFLHLHFVMKAQFVFQVTIQLRAAPKRPHSFQEAIHAVSMTCAMARARRLQLPASFASCFRPSADNR